MIENSLGPFPLQIQQVYFICIVILWHKLVLHVTFIIKEEQKWVLWYYWCHSCCYSSVLFCPVHCVSCDLVAGITCDHSCWGELEMCKSCKKEGGMLSEESYLAWKSVKCVIIKKKTTTLPPPPQHCLEKGFVDTESGKSYLHVCILSGTRGVYL